MNNRGRIDKKRDVAIEDGENQVKRQELRTHCMRFEVPFAFSIERFHCELAQCAEDEESVLDKKVTLSQLSSWRDQIRDG